MLFLFMMLILFLLLLMVFGGDMISFRMDDIDSLSLDISHFIMSRTEHGFMSVFVLCGLESD